MGMRHQRPDGPRQGTDERPLGEDDAQDRPVGGADRAQDADLASRSTTLMVIVPMRPSPPTTPSRIAIDDRNTTRMSNSVSWVERISPAVVVATTSTPAASSWVSTASASRSWSPAVRPGAPMTMSTPARPTSWVARAERRGRRVQERTLGSAMRRCRRASRSSPARRCAG